MATAEMLLADIRDSLSDTLNFYDATTPGLLHPELDGGFLKAQTVVRWINNAQAILGVLLHGITDWTAVAGVQNQDIYALDPRFYDLELGWYDGLAMASEREGIHEDDIVLQNVIPGTPGWWCVSRTAPTIQVRLWPAAGRTPASTTLLNPMNPADTTFLFTPGIGFGTTSGGFLSIGGSEIVRYQAVDTTVGIFTGVSRGQAGTRIVTHNAGDSVQELNIWFKGLRLPTPVGLPMQNQSGVLTLSDPGWQPGSYSLLLTDPLELPDYTTHLIVEYCLGRARFKENDDAAAERLKRSFAELTGQMRPANRKPRVGQMKVAGTTGSGLFWGRWLVP